MFKKTKKGLIAVVATLSLSSVMAAMSYSSASVTSDMSVKLTNTQDSLLALVASEEHNAATTSHITADMLNIDLSKGLNNQSFGVQPNSVYQWDDLFTVKNNSEHAVDVTVRLDSNQGGRIEIQGSADGASWTKLSGIHSAGGAITFTLPAGGSKALDIKTKSLNGHEEVRNLDLIVEGEKAE
jgi:LEA14-like dessication related protein